MKKSTKVFAAIFGLFGVFTTLVGAITGDGICAWFGGMGLTACAFTFGESGELDKTEQRLKDEQAAHRKTKAELNAILHLQTLRSSKF